MRIRKTLAVTITVMTLTVAAAASNSVAGGDTSGPCNEATQHNIQYFLSGSLEFETAYGSHYVGAGSPGNDCMQWYKSGWATLPNVHSGAWAVDCSVEPDPVNVSVESYVVGPGCSLSSGGQLTQIIPETNVEVTPTIPIPQGYNVTGGISYYGDHYTASNTYLVVDMDDTDGDVGSGIYGSTLMF